MTTMDRVHKHYNEAQQYFSFDNIVGIFLQGSQNYGLATPMSDVDTKLVTTPTFKEIAFNEKPMSQTHVRANDEHIDFKDLRLYIETFRKQNINFVEILFTPYYILNGTYAGEFMRLMEAREDIAHYNPWRAIKAMKGMAMEKYHALTHRYPAKQDIIEKYGYDGKQLSHMIRIYDFMTRYIKGNSYAECLDARNKSYLIALKNQGWYSLEEAQEVADETLHLVTELADAYCTAHEDKFDERTNSLLQEVQYNIMEKSVKRELLK